MNLYHCKNRLVVSTIQWLPHAVAGTMAMYHRQNRFVTSTTKWLKRWTIDPGVPGSSPTIAAGIFFSPRSLLSSAPKK